MIRLFLIIALAIAVFGLVNQHGQERQRFEQQLQTERHKRAAAELALAVANYRAEHGSLPPTVVRTVTPPYGAPDTYAFAHFQANWPDIVLEDGVRFEPDTSVYGGPGFMIDRYIYEEDGCPHVAYWKHGPRNRRGE